MDWFYVCLKVSCKCCFVFTLWAFKLLAFMDWFYVSMKVSFVGSFVFTKNAWKLLTFMDWSYVSLKVLFQSCFVFTLCTFMFYEYHVQCLKLWLSYWFIIIKLSFLLVKIPKAKVWPNDTNIDGLSGYLYHCHNPTTRAVRTAHHFAGRRADRPVVLLWCTGRSALCTILLVGGRTALHSIYDAQGGPPCALFCCL